MRGMAGPSAPAVASDIVTVSRRASPSMERWRASRKSWPERGKRSQAFSPSRNTPTVAGPAPPSRFQASPASSTRAVKSAAASAAGTRA